MPSIPEIARSYPVAWAVLALCAVSVCGLVLGGFKYRGVGLGTAGVLFAGLLFGHLGWKVEHAVLQFTKDFGLVLFVFTIGLQLGPGFLAAFRRNGTRLNLLALLLVLLGAFGTWLSAVAFGVDPLAALGLFSGATTNTPSLAASQQVLASAGIPGDRAALPALAYAVSYPAGIAGIIAALAAVRSFLPADVPDRAAGQSAGPMAPRVRRMSIVVENANLDGLQLGAIPGRAETGVAVSRVRRSGSALIEAADDDKPVRLGDVLLAVGIPEGLDGFRRIVGRVADEDLFALPSQVGFRRVVVTEKEILGLAVGELELNDRFGVTVTRVTRADIEMGAVPGFRLQFGDQLQLVGEASGLDKASAFLGNSVKELNATHFVPVFLGIALGVLLGLVPFAVPGLPAPVRLGLAGGPLIVALVLARIGHFGPLVWYMPINANLAFRELGITLFLASVGLTAGEHFFRGVFSPSGAVWLLAAVVLSVLPALLVAALARKFLRLGFDEIGGLLAGATTDPPALAFACALGGSDSPSVAYATVYPAAMLLRILSAQVLAILMLAAA